MNRTDRVKVLEVFCVLALACVVVALLTRSVYALYGAAVLLCVGLFVKGVAAGIATAWLRFSEILAVVCTRVVLTIVFFLLLTPIACLFRLCHKNVLQLKKARDSKDKTYFKNRDYLYRRSDLENPW